MKVSDVTPGMRVYHNKPGGYYSSETVVCVNVDGELDFEGGSFADPKDCDPKPPRGKIGNRELLEGTPVFDPQQNEVFYYCHKLDNPRSARLRAATPKQLDQLRNSGKLVLSIT